MDLVFDPFDSIPSNKAIFVGNAVLAKHADDPAEKIMVQHKQSSAEQHERKAKHGNQQRQLQCLKEGKLVQKEHGDPCHIEDKKIKDRDEDQGEGKELHAQLFAGHGGKIDILSHLFGL